MDDYTLLDDWKNRRLYVNDLITDDIVDVISMNIIKFNQEDKNVPITERKPIIIYLNTPGGNISPGFSAIDTILSSKTPVYIVNLGICYSMGFLLFISGKKRFSLKNSTFLLHDGSDGMVASAAKAMDYMQFSEKQMNVRIKDHVLNHTTIPEKLYEEKYRIEWYMYPEEAKKYGICTDIVGEDCDIDSII